MNREERHCLDQLSEYLDGELAAEERADVAEHLERCAACRAELEALRRTVEALGELPAQRAPAGFVARVKGRLATRAARSRPIALRAFLMRALPVAAMLAAVVGLILTVQKNGLLERRAAREPMALKIRPQAEARAREAPPAPSVAGGQAGAASSPERPEALAREVRSKAMDVLATGEPRRVEAEGPAALSWREVGQAAPMVEEAAREATPRALFTQAGGPPAPAPSEPVQQVLTISGEDPVELARQVVAAANARGVGATLSLGGAEPETRMEVRLSVPVEHYEALLRRLAELAPAPRNVLSNTANARGKFFRRAVALYRARQVGVEMDEEEAADMLGMRGGPDAARLRSAAEPPAGEAALGLVAEEEAPAERPARVNLLIQVQRPGTGD